MKNKPPLTVGFTYDLKNEYLAMGFTPEQAAEFDSPETINGVANALEILGYQVEKIGNVKKLMERLLQGHRWDVVFNICEGVNGTGREAQVPAVLDIYNIPYVFSDLVTLAVTLHKGLTKNIVRDKGILTAPFFVAHTVEDLYNHTLEYPLFIKPVAEGTGKGIGPDSKVHNENELLTVALERFRSFSQSLLVEEFLPGREFTVGIVGTGDKARAIGMMEVNFKAHETSGIYSYENKAFYEDHVEYSVPEQQMIDACNRVALEAWNALGCRDGGRVDLRLDARGIPNFIEVNPLAGLNPVHSDLPILARKAGISYVELLKQIMDSAMERIFPRC